MIIAPSRDDSYAQYMNEIIKYPLLSKEEEKTLAKRCAQGDKEARQRLIECNLRLVVHCANKIKLSSVDQMDLIQQGNLGLIHAIEKFDHTTGNAFSTYAIWWIKNYIGRYAYQYAQIITLPAHAADNIRAIKYLAFKMGRIPTLDEVMKSGKLRDTCGEGQAAAVLAWMAPQVESIDKPVTESESLTIGDLITFDDNDPADIYERLETQEEAHEKIEQLLNRLTERQRIVMIAAYGIGHEKQSGELSQLAKELGITRQGVEQLRNRAIQKMRG